MTWVLNGTARHAGTAAQHLTTLSNTVPRPKPPEPLKSRFVRMSDHEWEAFKDLGGADWLRKMMRTKPRRYYEVFARTEMDAPSKKELND